MVNKLNNANALVAEQIHTTFQRSYKIEAELIGTLNFPPLLRTANNIKNSITHFYGLYVGDSIAGVIELEVKNSQLEINSLVVDPDHFRKGIANRLMHFVLNDFSSTAPIKPSTIVVETAVVNEPAIQLYKKHGFVEFKRWTPEHGIEKLALIKSMTA
ncbi:MULTISPECIES: GNAT family N-acetyltransferase [unclassified Pseudoalteromonas]|uniref:GNAT family N-acetyltransferase n=1 Tax=unclassified Pseudoalteromonas TaxID=194690 RepID=UPI000C07893D|nr:MULTISPECIES: GNAT family N-acetyltransferase [unclassified Pseudoalteromonas]MDP2634364.1 GNAT family N-acetyltransferase [Pseudoalteromonas sp. 1_MG-2023]PHN89263.1 GNAT family N-acetyltransferase [Pseudoalteromonas sp. 3D05]